MRRSNKKRKQTKKDKEQMKLQDLLKNQSTMTQIFPKKSDVDTTEEKNNVSTHLTATITMFLY